MLARDNRITAPDDFRSANKWNKVGTKHLTMHIRKHNGPTRFGFILTKKTGNAVTRNVVKRRLRAISGEIIKAFPDGYDVIVRPRATEGDINHADLDRELNAAFRKFVR
jgi:ribonuclease P protein component